MSWTYDVAQLSTSDLFQVRHIIGDVESTTPLLSDEEIEFALIDKTVNAAAMACCKAIIARYSKKPDYSLGPYSVRNSDVVANFTKLLKDLQQTNSVIHVPVYTGSEPDRRIFDMGMMNTIEGHTEVEEDV